MHDLDGDFFSHTWIVWACFPALCYCGSGSLVAGKQFCFRDIYFSLLLLSRLADGTTLFSFRNTFIARLSRACLDNTWCCCFHSLECTSMMMMKCLRIGFLELGFTGHDNVFVLGYSWTIIWLFSSYLERDMVRGIRMSSVLFPFSHDF